jgi:integrase
MLEELQRRNYSKQTTKAYLHTVWEFALVHIREGKGKRDRNVPLSPKLLDALREYWRWMKPVTYVFPGVVEGQRVDAPTSDKVVWHACRVAAQHAGITKRVHPHTLRHASA